MTDEVRVLANNLHKQITDTQNQIMIVEDTLHSDYSISVRSEIGMIVVDDQTRMDIIDLLLKNLNNKLDDLQAEYEKL